MMSHLSPLGDPLPSVHFPVTNSTTFYSAVTRVNNPHTFQFVAPLEPDHVLNANPMVTSMEVDHFPQGVDSPHSPRLSGERSPRSQNKFTSRISTIEQIQQNTLDESVWESVLKEFQSMWEKLRHVIVPSFDGSEREKLNNWDLWGPLIICLAIGLVLEDPNQLFILTAVTFAGAMLITFNSRVLGGRVSFLQSVSILGYCVFPLFLCCSILWLLGLLKLKNRPLSLLLVSVGVTWCILSCRPFLLSNIPPGKLLLGMYPVLLFYTFLGTFIVYV